MPDPKKTKQFEITTRLKLPETGVEEEITLSEEVPPLESVEATQELKESFEESITEKIYPEPKPAKKEISVVTRRLKNIEDKLKTQETEDQLGNRLSNFVKLILLVCLRTLGKSVDFIASLNLNQKINLQQKISLKNKTTLWILGIVSGLLALLLVIVSVTQGPSNKAKITPTKNQTATQTVGSIKPLRLSPVAFYDLDGNKLDPNTLKAGSAFDMIFFAEEWHASPKELLELTAAIRVYAHTGKLLLYQPVYTEYAKKTDARTEHVEIKTRFKLAKDIPKGFYRVLITVTEVATQRRANVQTRIKVI